MNDILPGLFFKETLIKKMKSIFKIFAVCLVLGISITAESAMYIPRNQSTDSTTVNATGNPETTATTFSAESTTQADGSTSTVSQTAEGTISSAPWYSYSSWKNSGDVYDKYEWGVMGYLGWMTTKEMYHDMYFDYGHLGNGSLYTLEVDRQLPKDNWARKYLAPLLFASTIELAANVTYETDPTGPLVEFNPYFVFRWRNFPWNNKLLTTLGIGEGVSWASHSPQQEINSENEPGDATKFLNYVMAELTFSLPSHPEWQVLYRLHHRSGVFGLYCPGTVGSTAAGVGVRYWME